MKTPVNSLFSLMVGAIKKPFDFGRGQVGILNCEAIQPATTPETKGLVYVKVLISICVDR